MKKTPEVRNRKALGSTLAICSCFTFVFGLLASLFLGLLMVFGGDREGTNANDAGTLNVAKSSVRVSVLGSSEENSIYGSLAEGDAHDQYSLRTINKVWGHAFLTMMNSRSMNMTGNGTAASMDAETAAWKNALSISDKLSDALNTQENLEAYSNAITSTAAVRMLAPVQKLAPCKSWQSSCMNRDTESNIRIDLFQLPPHISYLDLGGTTASGALLNGSGTELYLKGYHPISFGNGRYINFVPFERNKQPHQVSLKDFQAAKLSRAPYPEWQKPVPNAFLCETALKAQNLYEHKFVSAAIANPMEKQDLSIPNGFIKINLLEDRVKWLPDGIPLGQQNTVPKEYDIVHNPFVIAPTLPLNWFEPFLDYGHQYYDSDGRRTVFKAIYAAGRVSDDIYKRTNELLMNRVNEIKPGTSFAEIVALLKSKDIHGAGDSFVIALDRNNRLVLVNLNIPAERALLNSYTLNAVNMSREPDGKVFSEKMNIPFSLNNIVLVLHWVIGPLGFPIIDNIVPGGSIWRHRLDLTPGTGVNGALLKIEQSDTTYAFFGADGPPVEDEGAVTTSVGCTCM
ncbi:MAG: hypothetical protein K2X27_14510 [Candidatus Obscuribacterales bacterium]|nr:hypothetical protein [Candidatus Obscuribacterales bacterium]